MGFFHYQYFWKEANDLLYILHRDNNQGNAACKTTNTDWAWPVVHRYTQACQNLLE